MQEELVGLSLMKPEADAALAQKSAAQAARAARRRKDTALKEFRSATTPNGLEVNRSCLPCTGALLCLQRIASPGYISPWALE